MHLEDEVTLEGRKGSQKDLGRPLVHSLGVGALERVAVDRGGVRARIAGACTGREGEKEGWQEASCFHLDHDANHWVG